MTFDQVLRVPRAGGDEPAEVTTQTSLVGGPFLVFPARAGMNRRSWDVRARNFRSVFPARAGMNRIKVRSWRRLAWPSVPRAGGDEPVRVLDEVV